MQIQEERRGDDCVISIPCKWYGIAVELGYKAFVISVKATSISLVSR